MSVKPKRFPHAVVSPKLFLQNLPGLIVMGASLLAPSLRAQNLLATFEREMRQLVETAKPSVVTIMATTVAEKSESGGLLGLFRSKEDDQPEVKVGSGLIVSSDGFIVTKASVVREANRIEITLVDGEMLRAEKVAVDSASSVAVLKINGENFARAQLGSDESVEAGSLVTVIGNALGMPQAVSVGVVSAIHHSGVIQISANVDPGCSGSPVFNAQGQAVGIISGRMGLGATGAIPENYFSCTSLVYPLASYLPRLREIVQYYYKSRGWLGVRVMADTGGGEQRLRVLSLVKDGPAERSGMQVGDVIKAFANQPIEASTYLPALVAACKPGTTATVKVERGDTALNLEVQIGQSAPLALNELQAAPDELSREVENSASKTPIPAELKKNENLQLYWRIQNLERELKYLRSLQQK